MKFDPKLIHQLCQRALTNLGIPLEPKETTTQQSNEVLFILMLSECISMASSMDISVERRREIMTEIINMDAEIGAKVSDIISNIKASRNN